MKHKKGWYEYDGVSSDLEMPSEWWSCNSVHDAQWRGRKSKWRASIQWALCSSDSDTANKPYEAEAEAGQRTIENQINLEWSIFFILIKIKIIIETNKYWTGATQAFRIWPSKVRPHNHHILNGTVLAVGNFYSYSLNSIFTPTCSKICLNQNCTSVT